ncbi:MAG: hypothetical protein V4691_10760 [Pseudomonadota bacterium]
MLSFIARFIGFVLLAAAAMFAVIDGTKSIAASELMLTPLGTTWKQLNAGSLAVIQQSFEKTLSFAWSPMMTTLLAIPTFLIIALIAFLFLKLGNLRRRAYL